MFALEVDYLLGRSFAGSFRSRSEGEWPPHPGRLFSALAAAYFENGAGEGERDALAWLETQPPPSIFATEPFELPRAVTAYVPTNYPGDTVPVLRRKQPREFPVASPPETRVYFIWSSEPPRELAKALDDLASRAGYLGRACSLVRMRVTDAPPPPNYQPAGSGESLRVPSPGRLDELAALYEADIQPTAGSLQAYRRATPGSEAEAVQSHFGQMVVFRKASGDPLPIEAALTLTSAVRRALMGNGKEPDRTVPDVLNGHNGEHCAVMPLPFVGREHADGHLLGFAVVLPRGITPHQRRVALAACNKLSELKMGPAGKWVVEPERDTPLAWNLRPAPWTRASRRWSTATPILLDRFPKKKGPGVEEIISAACRRIGLPDPSSIHHSPYSPMDGVPPVPQFRLHRKAEERPRWAVHATLEFATRVEGPVLLGAGRYFGMGLLRPQPKKEDGDDGE